ncbi:peptidase M28, partial [Myroides odoratimimus]|nr:peptidase M28 [Myroides odoratimimus]
MKKYTLLAIGLLASNQANAQYSKENQKKYVVELASDAMKGRKFGTPENRLAAELIAEKFNENNLKPCVGDSYLIE